MERILSLHSDHQPNFAPPGYTFGQDGNEIEVCEISWNSAPRSCRTQTRTALVDAIIAQRPNRDAVVSLIFAKLVDGPKPWQFHIGKHDLCRLLQEGGLDASFRHSESLVVGRADVERKDSASTTTRYCIFFPDWLALTWSHEGTTGRSWGVFYGDKWVWPDMVGTLKLLEDQVSYGILISHPMFLAEAISAMFGRIVHRDLNSLNKRISQVENRTGIQGWSSESYGRATGNFGDLSANTSGVKVLLASNQRVVEFVKEIDELVASSLQEHGNLQEASRCADAAVNLIKYSEARKRHMRMQEIQLEYLTSRTEAQLTVVRQTCPRCP